MHLPIASAQPGNWLYPVRRAAWAAQDAIAWEGPLWYPLRRRYPRLDGAVCDWLGYLERFAQPYAASVTGKPKQRFERMRMWVWNRYFAS